MSRDTDNEQHPTPDEDHAPSKELGDSPEEPTSSEAAAGEPTTEAGDDADGTKKDLDLVFAGWLDGDPRGEAPEDDFSDLEEPSEEQQEGPTRSGLHVRLLMIVIVALVAGACLWLTREEFAYFLKSGDPPVDLGNLQTLRLTQEELDVPTNSYVKMDGLVVAYEASTTNKSYFYSPLFDIIVQTERPLPDKLSALSVSIPEHLLYLVQKRLVFPYDLSVSFAVEGRLLKASEAPTWTQEIIKFYSQYTKAPLDKTYIVLDGETPDTFWPYLVMYILSILALGITTWFLIGAIRRYRALQDDD